jgi:hypothetical protein
VAIVVAVLGLAILRADDTGPRDVKALAAEIDHSSSAK